MDIKDSLHVKRNALLHSMKKSKCLVASSIHMQDCFKDYSNALLSDKSLQTEVQKKLSEQGLKNNSLQWKTNLHNVEMPSLEIDISEFNKDVDLLLPLVKRQFSSQTNKPPYLVKDKTSRVKDKKSKDVLQAALTVEKSDDENVQKESDRTSAYDVFKTAGDVLNMKEIKKIGTRYNVPTKVKRPLGMRRMKTTKFISPLLTNNQRNDDAPSNSQEEEVDERLKLFEPKLIELIKSEIMEVDTQVNWTDIAGLESAKAAIQEAVVWPMLRPDIFTGLRRPPKGILLFGPPGTGKTLIGKCVASMSKSTFFSISASSLTSKWVGDGEKMVRALFTVARCYQPAVIFIDEIDSLLSQRSDSEHESSRRIKTEFLVQLDGARTNNEERLLLIAATNRPQELDEAARRRFVKRLYIPLPENSGRLQLIKSLLATEPNSLTTQDLEEIAALSEGYSGADIKTLCSDACLGPIRDISMTQIETIESSEVRPVSMRDFRSALLHVRSSVSSQDLQQYIDWDNTYGSGSR